MNESTTPMFVDLNPTTGHITPTTHDSIRTAFIARYPISENIPETIRSELIRAVDVFALAFGQANAQNAQLYNTLTDNGFLQAMRAFEMALRDCLSITGHMPLKALIDHAVQRGLLAGGVHEQLLYRMLRETRNAATHGEGTRHAGGSFLGPAIGVLIGMINHFYDSTSS